MTAFIGRREFITMIGGAAATWPLGARAQQHAERAQLIGALMNGNQDEFESEERVTAFEARKEQEAERAAYYTKHGWPT